MEQIEKDQIIKEMQKYSDEIILNAIQSGKSETSGLVGDIMKRLDTAIEVSVKRHVNGNIIGIKQQLEDYIKDDMVWKSEQEPYLKGLANLVGGGKILGTIGAGVVALSGAWLVIKSIIPFIRNIFHI